MGRVFFIYFWFKWCKFTRNLHLYCNTIINRSIYSKDKPLLAAGLLKYVWPFCWKKKKNVSTFSQQTLQFSSYLSWDFFNTNLLLAFVHQLNIVYGIILHDDYITKLNLAVKHAHLSLDLIFAHTCSDFRVRFWRGSAYKEVG